MRGFWRDLGHGVRSLRVAPLFGTVVVLTLALGIGGTTAIFSFVEGVLLRPLPFPDPERLVVTCEQGPDRADGWCGASPSNLADWARQSRSFEAMGLARNWHFGWDAGGHREGVTGGVATPGLFDVFRVRAERGRLFRADETRAGKEHVALVSDRFWRIHLGADPGAVGRSLDLDGEAYTLVGVLPRGFDVPELHPVDVWIPLWPPSPNGADYRWWRGFHPFARLVPGASLASARSEMTTIAARLAAEYPKTNAGWSVSVERLRDRVVGSVRPALLLFLAGAGLVLLIACANVAHLLLARASNREREFAVRASLGAGRGRLVRQLLAEGIVFAALGGAGGLLVAFGTVQVLVSLAPASFPRLSGVGLSGPVYAFAAAASALTALLFGLPPALAAGRADLAAVLTDSRGGGARREHLRLRGLLATGEIALALVLVAAAGLLTRSFVKLMSWQPGFDRQNLLTVQVFPSLVRYPKAEMAARLYDRVVADLRTLPGVVSASAASAGPLFGGDGPEDISVEGHPQPPGDPKAQALWYDVGPDYFRTLGVPLVRGRLLTAADDESRPLVALVNQTMARKYWPGEDPIGRHVTLEGHQMTLTVVGVVGDTRPLRPDQAPEPEIYWPYAQVPRWAIHFVVRTSVPPETLVPAVRARLRALDPEMDLGRFATLEDHLDRAVVNPRFDMTLVGLFALVAAAIAVVGIYGVLSFSVAVRTREIGLRVALGARPRQVLGFVLGQGMRLVLAGLGLGLAATVAVSGLLRSLLAGVSATDPRALTAAAAGLALVALLASVVPAWRAARVDPAVALRHE